MDKTLEKIYNAALKFLVPLSIEETYETIVKEAIKLVNAVNGSILLEQYGVMRRVYASRPTLYDFQPRKRGFAYKVYSSKMPRVVPVRQIAKVHPEITRTKAQYDVFIPLSYKNQTIGVLTVMSQNDKSQSKRDLNILKLFGPLATLAIIKTQLYDETTTALKIRDLFISMASHELKTPVTTITLYTQLVQRTLAGGVMPDKKWIDTLAAEVERLSKLINELLHVDQARDGNFTFYFRNCSLREIILRAIRDFATIHSDYQIIFDDKTDHSKDTVHVDFDKLLQVMFNLLNNAAKFSKPGSAIIVRLENSASIARLCVQDSGKGITKEDLPHIFDRFYRGSGNTHEGMGLGLYLTKQIIDAHKGNIYVDSQVGKGTTIEILLPKEGAVI